MTNEEKEKAMAELDYIEINKADIEYFEMKLARMAAQGASEEAILRTRTQLELLQECLAIRNAT